MKKIALIMVVLVLLVAAGHPILAIQKTNGQEDGNPLIADMQKIVLLEEGDQWLYEYTNGSAWYNVSRRVATAEEYQIQCISNATQFLPDFFNDVNDEFALTIANITQENITTTGRGNFLRRASFTGDILITIYKIDNGTTTLSPPLVFSATADNLYAEVRGDYALTVVTGNPTAIIISLGGSNFSLFYSQLALPSDPFVTKYNNKDISVVNITTTTEQIMFEAAINASYTLQTGFRPFFTFRYSFAKDIGLAISKDKLLPPSQLMSLTSNWEVAHRLITFSIQNSNFGNQQASRDKTTNGLQLFSVLLAVLIVSTIRRKN